MDVLIDIKTLQIEKNTSKKDIINVVSKGSLKKFEHFDMISYEDSELTGLQGNKTVIKIEKDSITMIRYGKNPSNMYFKENVSSNSMYNTPYGSFELSIKTKKIEKNQNEDLYLYKIKVEYDIEIKDLFQGKNILEIKVKEIKNKL